MNISLPVKFWRVLLIPTEHSTTNANHSWGKRGSCKRGLNRIYYHYSRGMPTSELRACENKAVKSYRITSSLTSTVPSLRKNRKPRLFVVKISLSVNNHLITQITSHISTQFSVLLQQPHACSIWQNVTQIIWEVLRIILIHMYLLALKVNIATAIIIM